MSTETNVIHTGAEHVSPILPLLIRSSSFEFLISIVSNQLLGGDF